MQVIGGLSFSGGFTVTPLAQAVAAATDDFIKYVSLLLRGEGTNGAQNSTIVDSSSSAHVVTRSGDVAQGTASPFSKEAGKWGVSFPGNGNYISYGSSSNLALGAGDFTIECWVYLNTYNASTSVLWDYRSAGAQPANIPTLSFSTTGVPTFHTTVAVTFVTGSTALSLGTWHHLAVVRSGSTITMYLNGTSIGTLNSSATLGIENFRINDPQGSYGINGHVSNFRIVKGTAIYTGAFTPPTTPLTAVANTQLLVCQSNYFKDGSANNFSATLTGTPAVSPFSPFANVSEYSTSVNGGSYYFDGNGDYLSVPNSTDFQFGSGNWTIEFWVYPTSFAGFNVLVSFGYNQASNVRSFIVYINQTTGLLRLAQSSNGSDNSDNSTGITLKLNSWQHVAIVRNGANITSYLNGVSSGTNISAVTLHATSTALTIGTQNDLVNYYTGFLSSLRMVKGSAVYTSNFTTASSPATAITNTKLLLSGINAGIIDSINTALLEVSGGAQISTAQEQFGSSSMYFDGSGDFIEAFASGNMYYFGTGDFTFEAWIKSTTSGTYNGPFGQFPAGTVLGKWDIKTRYLNANNFIFTYNNGTNNVDLAASPAVNLNDDAWHHIAVTRSGTTIRMFSDGVLRHSASISASQVIGVAGQPIYLGYNPTDAAYYTGYIDDLRITKGVARYTANFTPPTATFPGA